MLKQTGWGYLDHVQLFGLFISLCMIYMLLCQATKHVLHFFLCNYYSESLPRIFLGYNTYY